MIGDFISRILVMFLGYAYPAFECFKSVEKNRVDIEDLRFWCKYWIIVALLTVCERMADTFVSWVPMYGEAKLAFIIYLWYPKTKGTGYIYDTLLRPYVAKHETDIDRKLQELKARAWDFAIYYWQNCTKLGQTTFFQILQYLAAQSGKFTSSNNTQEKGNEHAHEHEPSAPPVSMSPKDMASLRKHTSKSSTKWPPRPPAPPGGGTTITNRAVSDQTKSDSIQLHLNVKTEAVQAVEATTTTPEAKADVNEKLQQARMRLRRSKPKSK